MAIIRQHFSQKSKICIDLLASLLPVGIIFLLANPLLADVVSHTATQEAVANDNAKPPAVNYLAANVP